MQTFPSTKSLDVTETRRLSGERFLLGSRRALGPSPARRALVVYPCESALAGGPGEEVGYCRGPRAREPLKHDPSLAASVPYCRVTSHPKPQRLEATRIYDLTPFRRLRDPGVVFLVFLAEGPSGGCSPAIHGHRGSFCHCLDLEDPLPRWPSDRALGSWLAVGKRPRPRTARASPSTWLPACRRDEAAGSLQSEQSEEERASWQLPCL